MTILIFDEDNFDRAVAMARSLTTAGGSVVICHKWKFYDSSPNECARPSQIVVTFFHSLNQPALTAAGVQTSVTISYAGGGDGEIPRPIFANEGFTSDEAKHICHSLDDPPVDTLKARILDHWKCVSERNALRLLCEAKQACGLLGNAGMKENFADTGITIHAPSEIKDWLAPFGKKPEDANAIDHVAGLIGSGDVKTSAKAVLDAASGNGEVLLKKIAEFLEPTANPATPS